MKKIIVTVMFALVGCSQQSSDTYESVSLDSSNENLDDGNFYAFQQKCVSITKNQSTNWMKVLIAEGTPYVAPNWEFFQRKYGS